MMMMCCVQSDDEEAAYTVLITDIVIVYFQATACVHQTCVSIIDGCNLIVNRGRVMR
jgi:hypothetical protein